MRRCLTLWLAVLEKDVRLFLADRRAAALSFLVPIILASSFGLIFHKIPGQSNNPRLPIVIVAESDGSFTQSLIAELLTSPRLEAEVVTGDEAIRRVGDRRPGVVLWIPRDYEQLAEWRPGDMKRHGLLQIRHNPLAESEGQWAEGIITEIALKHIAAKRVGPLLGNPDRMLEPPVTIQTSQMEESNQIGFNSYTHSFCGMTLQYLLFWGMESGLLFLRERQRSLWLRMRTAPIPLSILLAGKASATGLIALGQIIVTFAFGYLVFGVTVSGSLLGFALIAFGASGLAAATGLLVAALGGTEARARSICILAILGVSLLGGLWMPSFVLPGWAREISLAFPTTWAMRGLDGVTWQGRGIGAVLPNIAVLMGFTVLFMTLAVVKLALCEARRRRGIR